MKKHLLIVLLLLVANAISAQVSLVRKGTRAWIEVKGQPMLVLGGELSNSAATSIADIDEVMPRMSALGLNTVLVPAQWDLIEPVEGKFDFSLIDETIQQARANRLKVIFLWFGAWKTPCRAMLPYGLRKTPNAFHAP